MESEVREVEFEDALQEEKAQEQNGASEQESSRPRPAPGAQQPTPMEPVPVPEGSEGRVVAESEEAVNSEKEQLRQEAQEEIEALAPPIASKEWTFGEGEIARTYLQCELSVVGSAQWFKLLGEFLDEAMAGEHAISLNSILSPPTPGQPGQYSLQDFQDADMFVHALGKLLTVMPEFLEKSVCIWLSVPDYEWELVRELMRVSPTRGGMSHDQFEEIVTIFIDQNYGEIDRFFRVRFPRLRDHWRARAKEASQSRSPKR